MYNTITIFEVKNEYRYIIYLKIVFSEALLGWRYTIRNPVKFINLVKVGSQYLYYEVYDFLGHFYQITNAEPFKK